MSEVIIEELHDLGSLAQNLAKVSLTEEKESLLLQFPVVSQYFNESPSKFYSFSKFSLEERVVLCSVIATDQAERLLDGEWKIDELRSLVKPLLEVERFYSSIGGIVGYQCRMLQLLREEKSSIETQNTRYYPPKGIDISEESRATSLFIRSGIAHLPQLAEIYPLGGAADRLKLREEKTGDALPAARLPFLGKSLLEGLFADLQGREYLYYKIFGKQLITPVAMMTSHEKDNHLHIQSICEEAGYFGRPRSSMKFFCQPLVPTVTKEGKWCLQKPGQLLLKPGGHGAIWRLAIEEGVFAWFIAQGRTKALVRQINNPVAGVDYGLLAFTGIGFKEDKSFGFASCPRQVKASEGINVLIEKKEEEVYRYSLTNIEYCDFKKFGILDEQVTSDSPYSRFSSNTNILFVDLNAIQQAVTRCPIPGILVNLKKITYTSATGQKIEEEVARLESTMQNIADFFVESHTSPLEPEERGDLKTYITYNTRQKTISTAKREFVLGASLLETPEGCFLDLLKNNIDLLLRCGVQVPQVHNAELFFAQGPSCVFLYHPALGPLYSVIAQKIRAGRISLGSELQLEIAELDMENLDLKGSLLIHAEAIMGHKVAGILEYSERCGKCRLKNVKIRNRGIDRDLPNVYWKNEIARLETCHIILRGRSEFYAENVTFEGDHFIEVEDGFALYVFQGEEGLEFRKNPLVEGGWKWEYTLTEGGDIHLS